MKKDTPIIVFYVLYFSWLLTVTYLTPETTILNFFTLGVALFYFIFLREKGDLAWFWFGAVIPLIFASLTFVDWSLKFDISFLTYMPPWLPIAWGTTFVALRKFYILLTN